MSWAEIFIPIYLGIGAVLAVEAWRAAIANPGSRVDPGMLPTGLLLASQLLTLFIVSLFWLPMLMLSYMKEKSSR